MHLGIVREEDSFMDHYEAVDVVREMAQYVHAPEKLDEPAKLKTEQCDAMLVWMERVMRNGWSEWVEKQVPQANVLV
jgi:hypothetical protein